MELALDEQELAQEGEGSLETRSADTELPDSFDSLLRAAVDISDVPLTDPLTLRRCPKARRSAAVVFASAG